MKHNKNLLILLSALALASCSTNEPFYPDGPPDWGNGPGMPGEDDGNTPDFDTQIFPTGRKST